MNRLLNLTAAPIFLRYGDGFITLSTSGVPVSVEYAKQCKFGTYDNLVPVNLPRRAIGIRGMPASFDDIDGIIVTQEVVRCMAETCSTLPQNVSIFTVESDELVLQMPFHSYSTCAESDCAMCSEKDCAYSDPQHYHYEGCPTCTNSR